MPAPTICVSAPLTLEVLEKVTSFALEITKELKGTPPPTTPCIAMSPPVPAFRVSVRLELPEASSSKVLVKVMFPPPPDEFKVMSEVTTAVPLTLIRPLSEPSSEVWTLPERLMVAPAKLTSLIPVPSPIAARPNAPLALRVTSSSESP